MTKDKYPLYALAIVGSALAIWAGMPLIYLLFLACPVMMFFMMSGMNSSSRHEDGPSHGEDEEFPHRNSPWSHRRASRPHRSTVATDPRVDLGA